MPRNSDEAVVWPDEDSPPDLRAVLHRIELAEDTFFDSNPDLEDTQCLTPSYTPVK